MRSSGAAALPDFVRLDGDAVTIMVTTGAHGGPGLIHFGPRLPDDEDLAALARATAPLRHASQPNVPQLATLWPQAGRGYAGLPAMTLRRGDALLACDLALVETGVSADALHLALADPVAGVAIALDWRIGAGDVVRARATLTNTGARPLAVDRIASVALPLPGWARHHTRFHGRWAGEMRAEASTIPDGRSGGTSRGGRPGFGGGNWVIAHEADFATDYGRAIALHLAWSGDHELAIERDADGVAVQMAVRLDAGEVVLAPGAHFTTPEAVIAVTGGGRNGLRRTFHAHLRADVLPDRRDWPTRRVHLNSWEALGFDLDEASLIRLAADAAAIGAERFVVDDGWFAGRRDDTTSLGDWTPDPTRLPHGLGPVIAAAHAQGMDFGLWVEPEMVSPDSALYRAHPDWCLHRPGMDRPTERHQLVLNLARADVAEHVFGALDRLLSGHPIAYLKWDHNRALFPNDGAGLAQVNALYALIDRLRAAHPAVEIETCASGGGRIDYAMLSRCHRVWPSDNNDAIERLRINRAWSLFLPPEVMGNHVGPSPNPITGRVLPMDFRAKVAMFGHMGVEADPAAMAAAERDTLAAHIALYKALRQRLHGGAIHEITTDDPAVFAQMVGDADTALALVARTDFADEYNAAPIRFPGLSNDARYAVSFPLSDRPPLNLSGTALAHAGLVLPLARPATAFLVIFERIA
ncbi:MAG: alpha-galactosidase [Sphingomonas sp.]|uniref:alpha-galactosidase n=1 Tax=Sphingomonas sp. TaxID=28214 RepID=UPI0017903711|nr:alpha-galactosidase [Zymomonas sp.]MBA4772748.1 alpha-galactosidase [Sphingomonas sp.]